MRPWHPSWGTTAALDVVMIPLERGTNQAHVLNGVAYSGSEDFMGAPLETNNALTSVRVYSR